jgi:aspartate aminotransferase
MQSARFVLGSGGSVHGGGVDMQQPSGRARAAASEFATVLDFFQAMRTWAEERPEACDFTFGNPHDMPLPGLVAALRQSIEPQREDWFAYKANEAEPREVVAAALGRELGLAFDPEDIAMTAGAFGAIALAFHLVMDAGAEVIIPVPGWFCYAPMLRMADLVPVKAPLTPERFDLDLAAIDAAVTARTRMVVVNSPHNPTGRIYSRPELTALADLLETASRRIGARIWLLSDEPYRRIRFDGAGFTSPAEIYPWTLIDYSYGKVLLAPGQRLGYLALSPLMPEADRRALRAALFPCQMGIGWTFADALMQHSVPALESVSIDMAALAVRRERMLGALEQWGYRMTRPEGTFYLWGAAPGGDAVRFADALAARDVFVMPGTLFERPGDFRISLTASADMIERALPAFEAMA